MASLADGALTVAQIVFVNMILSGDNALVIGLTAQQLPGRLRRRAVVWGSAAAVLLQVAFALMVSRLLHVPGLRLAGALALILIARKLVTDPGDDARDPEKTTKSILGASLAILVANLAMSLDNVLAVGALSRGMPSMVALGIVVSAVILLAASSLVIALIERFRWVTIAGSGLLACTAAGMVCEEPLLAGSAVAARTGNDESAPSMSAQDDGAQAAYNLSAAPAELMGAASEAIAEDFRQKWSLTVYALALCLCFGNLRWWTSIRCFERDRKARDARLTDASPIPVPVGPAG